MKTKLRPSVKKFAELMEMKLRKYDEERGEEGWLGEDFSFEECISRIHDEIMEYEEALESEDLGESCPHCGNTETIRDPYYEGMECEAVDIGNFAMMLWHMAHVKRNEKVDDNA